MDYLVSLVAQQHRSMNRWVSLQNSLPFCFVQQQAARSFPVKPQW
jgi:hypothetical protein